MRGRYSKGAGQSNHPHEATYATTPQPTAGELRDRAAGHAHDAGQPGADTHALIGDANRANTQAAHRERTDTTSRTDPHGVRDASDVLRNR
ncbi:hypothetical protein [Kitasatospora sp. NPDC088134]|uniref:hypothetical protein n=1 Tax=Kitasatospora sp. NPDC088134 TaxID=3364071 RepID=UPI003823488A